MLSLEEKTVLVTGGSRGIGAATVRMFRRAGARVVFSYEKARETAEALAFELGGPEVCRAVQQELKRPVEGWALVAKAVEAFGCLDCLIVNHGVWPSHDQPIQTMSDAQWGSTIGINLDSVFGLVQAAAAQMLQQRSGIRAQGSGVKGHIVLIASTAAQRGEAFHADYAASKGALVSLTKSLSTELAAKGIYVNCVAPGWVATEMSQATLADPAAGGKIKATIPLGRVGHVDEIAGPVVFLCTPLAGFVSGEIFNVNGGAVLAG